MERNFLEGDWCFFEFELSQIQEMKDSDVTQVSNGVTSCLGQSLTDRCYPLDMSVKIKSDSVEYWRDKLHKVNAALNYPDLHRELVRRWVELCDSPDEKTNELYVSLNKFCQAVIDKADRTSNVLIDGIKIFR